MYALQGTLLVLMCSPSMILYILDVSESCVIILIETRLQFNCIFMS